MQDPPVPPLACPLPSPKEGGMVGRDSCTQQRLLTSSAFPRFLLFTATRSVCWHGQSPSGLSSDDLPFKGGRASQEATTVPVPLCTNQPFMAQVGHFAAVPQAKVPSSGWPGSTPQGAAGKSQEATDVEKEQPESPMRKREITLQKFTNNFQH